MTSGHPLMEIDNCVADLDNLDLPAEILEAYAAGNATRLFLPHLN